MAKIVQSFGRAVQDTCDRSPIKARRVLRLGYHAKNVQFKLAPGKMHSAARLAAIGTTSAMVAPLDHPDQSVMVSLFTPCEMIQIAGLDSAAISLAPALKKPSSIMLKVKACRKHSVPTIKCSSALLNVDSCQSHALSSAPPLLAMQTPSPSAVWPTISMCRIWCSTFLMNTPKHR